MKKGKRFELWNKKMVGKRIGMNEEKGRTVHHFNILKCKSVDYSSSLTKKKKKEGGIHFYYFN